PGSRAFLSPLFGRTQLLAQCNGVTQAAALVHDDRIGVGQVYHLFRLPEDMEQAIHRFLNDEAACGRLEAQVADRTDALAGLRTMAGQASIAGVGPALVGATGELRNMNAWSTVAAHYLHAFEQSVQVFPYFRNGA
ncbi:MAG TPA: BrxE family protein, partial [Anaerolineae bacterium]|nr:BrxE family protein [Anaerolineae bacterium]